MQTIILPMHVCSKLEKMKSDFVRGSADGRRNCI